MTTVAAFHFGSVCVSSRAWAWHSSAQDSYYPASWRIAGQVFELDTALTADMSGPASHNQLVFMERLIVAGNADGADLMVVSKKEERS